MKYLLYELQNEMSNRSVSEVIVSKNLADAKRKASRAQFFEGTVLVLTYDSGFVVSTKIGKLWRDENDSIPARRIGEITQQQENEE